MPRHDLDPVSLMAGLLFLDLAAVFLLIDLTSLAIDGRWIGPIVLISVGAAGLLSTLRGRGST
jgi:hypothetical protein